jgi:multiple sugar transport system ATP-binding protein
MASITLDRASKRFGGIQAIDAMSLDVHDGEFFVLLGPSGAGKTTTLRLIAGLETPDVGAVRMDGDDVTNFHPAARDCAFVFQQYSLYPHLTAYDNIAFPLRSPLRRVDEAQVRKRVEDVARLLHMEGKLGRRATALSGGEMQRVAIGRALVRRPRVFLMDEPLSSLDAKLREELRIEIKRIQRDTGTTVVYVTHDQVEATTMADRIGILEQGRLQQVGTPLEIYERPASLRVAQRLGSPAINALPVRWFAGDAPAAATTVALRPEDVEIAGPARGDDVLEGTILECSLPKHQLIADHDGVEIRARALLEHAIAPGERVAFRFPRSRRLYFDGNGTRVDAAHPA